MIVKAQQLKDDLQDMFPNVKNFWPFDPKYALPTVAELDQLIVKAKQHPFLKDYVNRGPVEDCDNAALYSSAIVAYEWARMGKTDPCPYGRAMGWKFRGMRGGHSLNICFTQDGIYFVDFDAGGRKWKASSENDSIFYAELS